MMCWPRLSTPSLKHLPIARLNSGTYFAEKEQIVKEQIGKVEAH
jgi:hypothetical protein